MVLFLIDGELDPILNIPCEGPCWGPKWDAPGAPNEEAPAPPKELAPKLGVPLPPLKPKLGFIVSPEAEALPNENTPCLAATPDPKLNTGTELVVGTVGFPKGLVACAWLGTKPPAVVPKLLEVATTKALFWGFPKAGLLVVAPNVVGLLDVPKLVGGVAVPKTEVFVPGIVVFPKTVLFSDANPWLGAT